MLSLRSRKPIRPDPPELCVASNENNHQSGRAGTEVKKLKGKHLVWNLNPGSKDLEVEKMQTYLV